MAEIRALRKGRGLQARDLDQRVGVHLRELAAGGGDLPDLRHALADQIGSHAARLPDDLRTAVLASLGLSAETRQLPHFGDRVGWLAEQSARSYRTALRRVDIAEQLLAEEITHELCRRRGRTAAAPNGWYLDELSTVLRLDTLSPEAHERRRLVATQAGLSEVMAWLDVPRNPGQPGTGLAAEVLYGGRLLRREAPSHSRIQFVIQLPAPLDIGESHDYELILRVPPGEHMRPHYIFTPECQCNSFDLRVRFGPERAPAWIRRVEAETVRMFDDVQPGSEKLVLNAAGEAHVQFRRLITYLGYGLQWQPSSVTTRPTPAST